MPEKIIIIYYKYHAFVTALYLYPADFNFIYDSRHLNEHI
jgi:hypothetical protein